MTRPRAILFDWDNTLIDSWDAIHAAQNAVLMAFGHELWTIEETRRRVRGSMRDSYPDIFGKDWEAAGELFYERFEALHMIRLRPLPGAAEMLADLATAGIAMGVVSNKKGDYLRQEVTHLGWDRYFGGIVGALDAPRDKPALDPVVLALEGSGVVPGPKVWFVGDTDIDMRCAANCGCVAVLIHPESPTAAEFPDFPDWHFSNCVSLSKFILTL